MDLVVLFDVQEGFPRLPQAGEHLVVGIVGPAKFDELGSRGEGFDRGPGLGVEVDEGDYDARARALVILGADAETISTSTKKGLAPECQPGRESR